MLMALAGCSTLTYYGQAIQGHLSLMAAREPIPELLADPATDAQLRRRLERARAIRAFASEALALPANDSYTTYAQLDRPYVVWNVVATPELSLEPRQWCLPVAGCVSYRGYFARADAEAYAQSLAEEGLDVYTRGAIAYSTLGWFDDPLVSPMLRQDDLALAEVIFHELAHQRLYVKGETMFNEGFATTVGEAGTRRWAERQGPETLQRYEQRLARREAFFDLVEAARGRLEAVYVSDRPDPAKRRRKAAIIDDLRADYRKLKRDQWDGYSGYDAWFAAPINNAKLVSVATYRELVPAFRDLLAACDHHLPCFYQAAGSGLEF